MADVLLTGASGLLGSRLGPLLAANHRVTAIARRPAPGGAPPGMRWVVQDLTDEAFSERLPSSVDVVIHLAQAATFREFPEKATETFAINVASTAQLLDWARRTGARQFVLASTGSVYTDGSGRPHREDECLAISELSSYYAASKLAGEALATSYRAHFAVLVLRPFVMYGPAQDRTMLIPRLIDSIRSATPVQLAGEHGMKLNPIYVDDAARAVDTVVATPRSGVVNLAGPEVLSLREIADQIGDALGARPLFERVPRPAVAVIGDTTKMTDMLGPPTTRFRDVVQELCRSAVGGNGTRC